MPDSLVMLLSKLPLFKRYWVKAPLSFVVVIKYILLPPPMGILITHVPVKSVLGLIDFLTKIMSVPLISELYTVNVFPDRTASWELTEA